MYFPPSIELVKKSEVEGLRAPLFLVQLFIDFFSRFGFPKWGFANLFSLSV